MRLAAERSGRKHKPDAAGPDPADLLDWYDRHRRVLPWRAGPGVRADPYSVWLSEIMLQQTAVKAVIPYYERFLARFPTVEALAAASLDDVLRAWAGLGYYARGRNLHGCAQAVAARYGGQFPESEEELRALPGIGPYTAAAIVAIAFDRHASPVDGNIERVVARLYAVEEQLPAAKPVIAACARALTPEHRPGDFAQAMMDLGATICTPKNPACAICPWCGHCAARARGDPETFPRKTPKATGHLRRGAAFVALREDGCVLLRTRPQKGLLGGMTEVPTSEWQADFDGEQAVVTAPAFGDAVPKPAWTRCPGVVTHVFTHFPLELVVYRTNVPLCAAKPAAARWVARADLADEALPNVMRKVLVHALGKEPPRRA